VPTANNVNLSEDKIADSLADNKAFFTSVTATLADQEIDGITSTNFHETEQFDETGLDEVLFFRGPVNDTVYVKKSRRYEPFGIAASVSLVSSFVVAFAPFTPVFPLVAFILLGIAFILSIVSMISYFWHKERYQSNLFGIVTFVICIGLLCLSVFILLTLLALV